MKRTFKGIRYLKELLLAGGPEKVRERAKRAGTTEGYIYKLALGHGLPSMKKMEAICRAFPNVQPEDFLKAHKERESIGRIRPYRARTRP
jgi:transcriptional regulator with XRE-family HTH domain